MTLTKTMLALASAISIATTSPLHASREAVLPLPAKTIFQFNETGTWFENLAVRPNGDLLMTMLQPTASIYTLKRPYDTHPELALVHTFAGAPGLTGIAETKPDTFVVLNAEFQATGVPVPGSWAVWELAFNSTDSPSVHKVGSLPDAQLLNGVAPVSSCNPNVLLVGDSFAGTLWRLDMRTGTVESVLSVPEMAAPFPGVGINGLKVREGFVYWGNSAQASIYRARVDKNGYPLKLTGPGANSTAAVEMLAKLDSPFVDDFAFDARGLLWVATNRDNKVDVVRPGGTVETVAGGATEGTVAGDSAVAFGRTAKDRDVVYVTTSGVLPDKRTEGAKVVAVDRAGFR
ncbi:hypothetical protein GGS26DRAFT_578968 [Hypomontagnella submonticulosa]|nr:hypothetical protein GGS26DRAFT_578968 [Hypomontagnella submonticulosa]